MPFISIFSMPVSGCCLVWLVLCAFRSVCFANDYHHYIELILRKGLFWLAFTTYPSVHWIVPIIASFPLGTGYYLSFNSVFTYLVVAYRPIAASAMAGNSFLRSSFACAFPLFSSAMYNRLGTVGATALLAGLTTIMMPLP
jgi:hypothetical protein